MSVAITGALSYTGRYLTEILLKEGASVVNLSNRSRPIATHNIKADDWKNIYSRPLNFDNSQEMKESMGGCDVLYCTYWIRFERNGDSHEAASQRLKKLFYSAAEAGVKKIIFSAHTKCQISSPFSYIRGKALAIDNLKEVAKEYNINYAVVKPCGIFGDTPDESILFNNAAYVMRRTPLFLLPEDGSSIFQPIHVRDMAQLMYDVGSQSLSTSGEELDAVGPDAPSALSMFQTIGKLVGAPAYVVASGLPTSVISTLTKPIDFLTKDILLDRDDLDLLCSGLTCADNPNDPRIASRRSLFDWLQSVSTELGQSYISSTERYYK